MGGERWTRCSDKRDDPCGCNSDFLRSIVCVRSVASERRRLSNALHITDVRLHNNGLAGVLPSSWSAFVFIAYLDLSRNALTGALPAEWASMKLLQVIQLQDNKITGELPPSWKSLTMVTHMTLHGNAFTTGCPPCAWSNMAALESITLYSYGTSHDCGPRPDNCTIRNGTSSGVQSQSGLTDALIAMQIFALTVVIALVVRIIISRVFHERRQKNGSTSASKSSTPKPRSKIAPLSASSSAQVQPMRAAGATAATE